MVVSEGDRLRGGVVYMSRGASSEAVNITTLHSAVKKNHWKSQSIQIWIGLRAETCFRPLLSR